MSLTIRPAETTDIDAMVNLLVLDAGQRHSADPALWKLVPNLPEILASTLAAAMERENAPFRQQWLLADNDGQIVGLTHSILLPVPPIYAGEFGPPGLIMEDCFAAEGAPAGTIEALLRAAEADLREAGAELLLGSSVPNGVWATAYMDTNYRPLTVYLAKAGLSDVTEIEGVRSATEDNVADIVVSSAENRCVLHDLNAFWKPHVDADARFGGWMKRSLKLTDRDMFVSGDVGDLQGYVVSQPASSLHFPAAHDIAGIGFIDDYFHTDFTDPSNLKDDGNGAAALLNAAEGALVARGNTAALIVCPAAWLSKISLLQGEGYETAIVWYIKG